jgi:hypothetical protein
MHRCFPAAARFVATVTVVLGAVAAVGCGTGDLRITTSGGDFIEAGIPTEFFADGGSVTFSTFLVTFSDIAVSGADGTVGGAVAGPVVFDVHQAGPIEVATLTGLQPGPFEDISVAVSPANDDALAGNVDGADLDFMAAQGFSVYVEGTASQDDVEKSFAWGFSTNTRIVDCALEDGTPGVVVPAGGQGLWDLTIHGDHLFLDDLVSEDAALRLSAIMLADSNADDVIERGELDAVDLSELPTDQYGVGGASDVLSLGDYMAAQSRTLVHHTGEGECTAEKR